MLVTIIMLWSSGRVEPNTSPPSKSVLNRVKLPKTFFQLRKSKRSVGISQGGWDSSASTYWHYKRFELVSTNRLSTAAFVARYVLQRTCWLHPVVWTHELSGVQLQPHRWWLDDCARLVWPQEVHQYTDMRRQSMCCLHHYTGPSSCLHQTPVMSSNVVYVRSTQINPPIAIHSTETPQTTSFTPLTRATPYSFYHFDMSSAFATIDYNILLDRLI